MSPAAGEGRAAVERRIVDLDAGSVVVLALTAALAAALWAVVTIAPDMVTKLAIGLVVGLALSPIVGAAERRFSWKRSTAALVVGASLVVALAAVLLLVAPPAVRQARSFTTEVPETVRELYSWPIVGHRLEESDAAGDVEEAIDELPSSFDDEALGDLGERVLGGALSTIVALIAALGVLVDGPTMVRRIRSLVPPSRQGRADEVGRIVYESFGSYFAGSLLVAVLNGMVILTTGLVLGVPLAPVAGVWSTLTNFIPQIGGFLGGSFFVVLALTKSPLTAVIAAAVFLAYQQLENNVVQPAVVGSAVNLTPPATMMAALIGGAAAGVPGALVATPLMGAGKALYLDWRGMRPPKREAALTRRLKARVKKVQARVDDVSELARATASEVVEKVGDVAEIVREHLPGDRQ